MSPGPLQFALHHVGGKPSSFLLLGILNLALNDLGHGGNELFLHA